MKTLSDRLWTATWHAVAAFVIAGVVACDAFTGLLVITNPKDGQAGVGIIFVVPAAGVIAAVITFVVSLVRSHRSNLSGEQEKKSNLAGYVVGTVLLSWLFFFFVTSCH